VREIRNPDGETTFRHQRRVVRRVMEPEIARQVREMLIGVVDSGTAREAGLAAGPFAGKTGTARLTLAGRGYSAREHLASFVGMFPADKPQLVILVKLVNPRGSYGGRTAAPVSKEVIEAAIAARSIALGRKGAPRSTTMGERGSNGHAEGGSNGHAALVPDARLARSRRIEVPIESPDAERDAHVISLDAPPRPAASTASPRAIPDVTGLPLRAAVFELHRAGFRVRLAGPGRGTYPAANVRLRPGSLVHLYDRP
jgi:cell division protein FtsI (penicillin-binding protein 3)